MSSAIQEEPIVGREPTPEEVELVEWARAAVRQSVVTVQECLKQLVTLTTALLAGSAALLGPAHLPVPCKIVSGGLLLVALGAALWGILPREASLDVRCPEEIRGERQRGLAAKMQCLRIAATTLLAAFVVVLVGLLLG